MPVGNFCEATDEICIYVTSHFNLCVFNSIFPTYSRPVTICAIRFSIRRELSNWLSMILCRESMSRSYFVTYLNFIFTFSSASAECPSLITAPNWVFTFKLILCQGNNYFSTLVRRTIFIFAAKLKLVSLHFENVFNYLNKVICGPWRSRADIQTFFSKSNFWRRNWESSITDFLIFFMWFFYS